MKNKVTLPTLDEFEVNMKNCPMNKSRSNQFKKGMIAGYIETIDMIKGIRYQVKEGCKANCNKKRLKLLLLLGLLIPCLSFAQVRAKHNPRYMEEGIYLNQGGQIAKDNTQCRLINVKNTMRGFRHTFVSDSIGVLYRYYYKPLVVDSCYFVSQAPACANTMLQVRPRLF